LETLLGFFRRPFCVNRFRGQIPHYGASVSNKHRSVGFAHEPIKISDDLFSHYFYG